MILIKTWYAQKLPWQAVGLFASGILAAATPVLSSAQTLPFQSERRGEYGSGPGQTDLPQGGRFLPRIEASVQYADNLTLAESGEEKVTATGLEVAPGFFASYASDLAYGAIDYSLIGRVWDEDDLDNVSQRLMGNGRWHLVQELFYVDGQASYLDSVIDPSGGLNYGGIGIFSPENLVETATASVSPTLRKQFGGIEALADYSYGRVWYLDVPDDLDGIGVLGTDDSTDQSLRLAVGTADSDAPLTGRLFYDWEKSEYERALPYRFDRLGIEGDWRMTDALAFVGDAGVETALDENTTDGGLDDEFWHLGLRWKPDNKTDAEVRFGQRFFGDSYFLSVSRQSRILQFEASYSEMPTIETRLVSIGDFEPGNIPIDLPSLNASRLSNSPFISKDASLGVAAQGTRTRVGFKLYEYRRDYLRSFRFDEVRTGGELSATRQFGSKLSGDLEATYQDYEGANPAVATADADHFYDTQIIFRLNQGWSSKLTSSLESGYFSRSGDEDFHGWWVALRTRYVP